MSYDWKEIMKSKTTKELFEIAIGKTQLDKEAMNAADDELKNRNFSLENKEPIRNKIEFESLVKEQEVEDFRLKNSLFPIENKYFSKEVTIIGLLIIGVLLILFFEDSMLDKIVHSMILISFLIYFVFNIKKKKNRALFRKERIEELKKMI